MRVVVAAGNAVLVLRWLILPQQRLGQSIHGGIDVCVRPWLASLPARGLVALVLQQEGEVLARRLPVVATSCDLTQPCAPL